MTVLDAQKTEQPVARPKSNWAQLVSAGTSIIAAIATTATTGLAIYAIFFSSTSQALVQYLQSELAYRNHRILNLEDAKDLLEKSISFKEQELKLLDKKTNDLNTLISSLESKKNDAEKQIDSLLSEQLALSKAVNDARSNSIKNEFSYIKEKLYSSANSIIVVTWPLKIIGDESRTKPLRETLWPHYVNIYRKNALKMSATEQPIALRIVDLFEKKCIRFKGVIFDIPVPIIKTGPNFERLTDARIEEISQRALKTQSEIEQCLRSLQDD